MRITKRNVEKVVQEKVNRLMGLSPEPAGIKSSPRQKEWYRQLRNAKSRKLLVETRKKMFSTRKKEWPLIKGTLEEVARAFAKNGLLGFFVIGSWAHGKQLPRDMDLIPVFHGKTQGPTARKITHDSRILFGHLYHNPPFTEPDIYVPRSHPASELLGHQFCKGEGFFRVVWGAWKEAQRIKQGKTPYYATKGFMHKGYAPPEYFRFIGSEKVKVLTKKAVPLLKKIESEEELGRFVQEKGNRWLKENGML